MIEMDESELSYSDYTDGSLKILAALLGLPALQLVLIAPEHRFYYENGWQLVRRDTGNPPCRDEERPDAVGARNILVCAAQAKESQTHPP